MEFWRRSMDLARGVFVRPEQRSLGVGSALLKKAASLALQRGFGRMEWTALDWNLHAQQF